MFESGYLRLAMVSSNYVCMLILNRLKLREKSLHRKQISSAKNFASDPKIRMAVEDPMAFFQKPRFWIHELNHH